MSLPWNRVLHLQLAADTVRASLDPGWRRGAARVEAQCAIPPAAATPAASGHAEAIAAVLQDIAAQAPLKGARLEVTLSSALLHLDVVEGGFADHGDRQLQAIASACVAEMLGDAAPEHDVRWQLQGDDRHLLIVAIARSRLAQLATAAQAAGLRLASVRPEFVDSWNTFARRLRPGHGVFAVRGDSDLAIAAVVDGSIATLSVGAGIDLQDNTGEASVPAATPVYAKPGPPRLVTSSSGGGRGVFSSTRPMPQEGMDALDVRVDRLLVGIGQDPAAQSAFVLVAASGPATASQRWSVVGPQGVPA